MTLAEALLKHIFKTVLAERADDMAFFEERIEKGVIAKLQGIVECEFVRMDYSEAIRVLEQSKQKFEFPVRWGVDLQSEHERYISETHAKKPVVLMNYPKEIKAFYMRLNDDGRTVAAMDVLVPGIGEIVGGSQREERLEILDARMTEAKLDKEQYGWYRDLRRYGTVRMPDSGSASSARSHTFPFHGHGPRCEGRAFAGLRTKSVVTTSQGRGFTEAPRDSRRYAPRASAAFTVAKVQR